MAMALSFGGLLKLEQPEITTIIRWLLRVILVAFLAWLVRRKPESEEEEEEPAPEYEHRRGGAKARAASTRSMARMAPRRERDPYAYREASNLRQRNQGGNYDFDSVIDKVSKPKDMWEVRKAGDGPPTIVRSKPAPEPQASPAQGSPGSTATTTTTSPPGGTSALAALAASISDTPLERMKREARARAESGNKDAKPKPEEPKRPQAKGKETTLHGHERPITCITWNADGNLLFTCGKDKIVCVWSIPEGEQLGTYKGHSGAVWACSVTNDSRWLVTGGADQRCIVWEAKASLELARVELPGVVRCVEWAEEGERFVACTNKFGSKPASVSIWKFDGTEITQLLTISTLPSTSTLVRWLDKQTVASSHETGEIIFWNTDTGDEKNRLQAHDKSVSKFDFNQDRGLLATVSHDNSVRIWDLAEGAEFKKLYEQEADRPLNAVAFGPLSSAQAKAAPADRPNNISIIVAGGQDARDVTTTSSTSEQFGTLLYKLGKGEESPSVLVDDGVTKGHFGPVHTLAFAVDGSAMASGSEDGCVRLTRFDNPQRP